MLKNAQRRTLHDLQSRIWTSLSRNLNILLSYHSQEIATYVEQREELGMQCFEKVRNTKNLHHIKWTTRIYRNSKAYLRTSR
jgi:hypothetical protein